MGPRKGCVLLVAAALAFAVTCATTASASTFTYDLTLTPVFKSGLSGTGILTLDEAISPTGFEFFGFHNLHVLALDVTIDNKTFDLTKSFTSIGFFDGQLIDIFAAGDHKKASIVLGFLGSFFEDGRTHSFDLVTAQLDPPASTPLPATWTMMLLGFAVLGFASYRGARKRTLVAA